MPANDNDKRADNDATVHDEVNRYVNIERNLSSLYMLYRTLFRVTDFFFLDAICISCIGHSGYFVVHCQ